MPAEEPLEEPSEDLSAEPLEELLEELVGLSAAQVVISILLLELAVLISLVIYS